MEISLPKAPIRRIFKQAGAERVSDEAINVLHKHLIEDALIIANNSAQLTKFSNRKTVAGRDVEAVLSLD